MRTIPDASVHHEVFAMFGMNKTYRDRSLFRILCAVSAEDYNSRNVSDPVKDMSEDGSQGHRTAPTTGGVENDSTDEDIVVMY